MTKMTLQKQTQRAHPEGADSSSDWTDLGNSADHMEADSYCTSDLGRQFLVVEHLVLSRCSIASVWLKEINLQLSQNLPAAIFYFYTAVFTINKSPWNLDATVPHDVPPRLICLRFKSKTNYVLLLTSLGTGKDPACIWLPVKARC